MAEVNEGIQIILNRMESNPEEFFGDSGKWNWMYKETMRDVMTEPEKAAIHVALTKVRRLELTAKAVATVLPDEKEEDDGYADEGVTKALMANTYQPPKKMIVNRAQAELIQKFNGGKL